MKNFCCLLLFIVCIFECFAEEPQIRQLLQTGSVMGFRHYEGKLIWNELAIGEKLTLIREPANAYDSQAIRIEWQGHKLGYVPKADNVDLARIIDNGTSIEARITALNKSRRPNNRVFFEVYLSQKNNN